MVSEALFSSSTDEWYTPQAFFEACEKEVGGFDLDPCATSENCKAKNFFTQEDDGLLKEWFGKVFVNPPYSEVNRAKRDGKTIHGWIEKCERERERVDCIYLLIPSRTDTKAFHKFLYNKPGVEIRFIAGRLKFGGAENSAPFPSLLAIFRKTEEKTDTF